MCQQIGLALVLAQIQTCVPQVRVREQYMYGAQIAERCCDNCKSMVARFTVVHGDLMGRKLRLSRILCCGSNVARSYLTLFLLYIVC